VSWKPIETAPQETLVLVLYRVDYDTQYPTRSDIDFKDEDGVWQLWADWNDNEPPYTHWAPIPPDPEG